jgi:hypothetical protein
MGTRLNSTQIASPLKQRQAEAIGSTEEESIMGFLVKLSRFLVLNILLTALIIASGHFISYLIG